MNAFERAEQDLEEALESGDIDIKEYNYEMRCLHQEAEDAGYF
jgi:hypothetical protein